MLQEMSYGDLLFYGGILLTGISAVILIAGNLGFSAEKKKLSRKLFDRYGF